MSFKANNNNNKKLINLSAKEMASTNSRYHHNNNNFFFLVTYNHNNNCEFQANGHLTNKWDSLLLMDVTWMTFIILLKTSQILSISHLT